MVVADLCSQSNLTVCVWGGGHLFRYSALRRGRSGQIQDAQSTGITLKLGLEVEEIPEYVPYQCHHRAVPPYHRYRCRCRCRSTCLPCTARPGCAGGLALIGASRWPLCTSVFTSHRCLSAMYICVYLLLVALGSTSLCCVYLSSMPLVYVHLSSQVHRGGRGGERSSGGVGGSVGQRPLHIHQPDRLTRRQRQQPGR